MMANDKI